MSKADGTESASSPSEAILVFRVVGWASIVAIGAGVAVLSLNLFGVRVVSSPVSAGLALLTGGFVLSWLFAVADLVLHHKGPTFAKWREYARLNYLLFYPIETLINRRDRRSL